MTPRPILLLVLLLLAPGCQTQGEKMVESFSLTRKTVAEARQQVGQTILSLSALRSAPASAMKDSFHNYRDQVAKLEEEAADARRRAKEMREESDAHVKQWQDEMKTLKDPSIKATMEERREAVRTNYKLLEMYAQDVRTAFGPYLAGNKDIIQALSIDLSPAAIDSLAPSINRVLGDGQNLQQKLNLMQRALDNIANGVSPIGETS
jgi:hypothetical protein